MLFRSRLPNISTFANCIKRETSMNAINSEHFQKVDWVGNWDTSVECHESHGDKIKRKEKETVQWIFHGLGVSFH